MSSVNRENRTMDMSEELRATGLDHLLVAAGVDPTAIDIPTATKIFASLAGFDVAVTLKGHEWEMVTAILDLARPLLSVTNPTLLTAASDALASMEKQAAAAVNGQDRTEMIARVSAALGL